MKNFFTRTGSAVVFVSIMLAGILWNPYAYLLLTCVIVFGCLYEFYNITESKRDNTSRFSKRYKSIAIALGLFLCILSFFFNQRYTLVDIGVFLPVVFFFYLHVSAIKIGDEHGLHFQNHPNLDQIQFA